MAKGPKGFSSEEKDQLRAKLRRECEQSWAAHGYKKTSVSELTSKIGISTGAFYLLYSSKEDLFCETLQQIQQRLNEKIRDIIGSIGGKEGFTNAIIWHFQEYDRAPFLYDTSTPDFLAFLNRLPAEQVDALKYDSGASFNEMVDMAGIKPKVEPEKAQAVISALLYLVTLKGRLAYDHFAVFSFLLDSAMDDLFE